METFEEHKKVIDRFLKNRETLKKKVVDEKIGMQAQRQVTAEFQKPVLHKQKVLQDERQQETDQRQNKLIAKLQENQVAYTEKLDDKLAKQQ